MSDLAAAQHEAAHIAVGLLLGLRLGKASARAWPAGDADGWTWFPLPPGRRSWAESLMIAAGVAWERAAAPGVPDTEGRAHYDWLELLGRLPSRHDAETCVRAAGALLANASSAHTRITRALFARDLNGKDIEALARGERLDDD